MGLLQHSHYAMSHMRFFIHLLSLTWCFSTKASLLYLGGGLNVTSPPLSFPRWWYQTRARARLSEFITLRQLSSCGVEGGDPSYPTRVTDRLLTIKPALAGRKPLTQNRPQAFLLMPGPNRPHPNLVNYQVCQQKFDLLH